MTERAAKAPAGGARDPLLARVAEQATDRQEVLALELARFQVQAARRPADLARAPADRAQVAIWELVQVLRLVLARAAEPAQVQGLAQEAELAAAPESAAGMKREPEAARGRAPGHRRLTRAEWESAGPARAEKAREAGALALAPGLAKARVQAEVGQVGLVPVGLGLPARALAEELALRSAANLSQQVLARLAQARAPDLARVPDLVLGSGLDLDRV